ncbi:hypothetical protein EGR_06961 [Echinococcus granulosus]|uniref:Protein ABHD18 n=1 Tax=Echinococcus granulosus TaxID=6210 RepID=W6UJ98_ECHGR|nr:hypothetical protein EGR_06961 [Echinococcus granulosus]EUB58217.1 hypothetical protein EGR_06961 [Echinococcus granulosus]
MCPISRELFFDCVPRISICKGPLKRLVDNMILVRGDPHYVRNNLTYRPVMIEKRTEYKKLVEIEGSFVSPMEDLIPDAMCTKNRISRFQMITPKTWKSKHRPVCLHYPGTGDHSYHRRRVFLANQLIDDGIASVIIMNPFYGARLPVDQKGSGLNYLSDLFVMGGALILECHTILRWCQNQGYGPFALHGVSMGGYMATICATTVPFPVSLIPCLSWTSASVVFIEGVLSHSVDWQTLTKQYLQDSVYSKVVRPKIQPSIQPAFITKTQRPANSLLSATSKTKEARSPSTDLLVPPPPPPSPPPSGQKTPDYIFDVLTFYHKRSAAPKTVSLRINHSRARDAQIALLLTAMKNLVSRPLSDVSKVLDYMKSHNRLHLYFDNHIWDSAVSAVRAVPIPSVFPEKVKVDPEVREFLRELLDFFTHLGNFPPVADARLITSVTAGRDAYVPRDGVVPFDVVFPAADIRYLPQSGHVSTYVRNYLWNQDFRKAVCDTMNRQMLLHYGLEAPVFGKVSKSALP